MNINVMLSSSTDYFSIVFGGLFGLATIMIAVFSIVSNEVKKSNSGLLLIDLPRYNIYFLLLPIYLVFLLILISIIFNLSEKNTFIIISFIIVLIDVSVQTKYILEPFYNLEKSKKTAINKKLNNFEKRIKSTRGTEDIIDELRKENETFFKCNYSNNFDTKADDIIKLSLNDKKDIYIKYIKVIRNKYKLYNEALETEIIDIGFSFLGLELLDIDNDCNFNKINLLRKTLKINYENQDDRLTEKIISLLQYFNSQNTINCTNEEEEFRKQCLQNGNNLVILIDFILNHNKWSYADTTFVYNSLVFIKRIIDITSIDINNIIIDKNKMISLNKIILGIEKCKNIELENKILERRINNIIGSLVEK